MVIGSAQEAQSTKVKYIDHEKPYIVTENCFTSDKALEWISQNRFRAAIICHCDRLSTLLHFFRGTPLGYHTTGGGDENISVLPISFKWEKISCFLRNFFLKLNFR